MRQFLGDVNTLLSGGSSIVSISDLDTPDPEDHIGLLSDLNASFSSGFVNQFAQDHLVAPSTPVPEPSSWVRFGSACWPSPRSGRRKRRR